jgi:hypothetical protein
LIEAGDASVAIQHEGPFGGQMPVQIANTARCEPHIDAGKAFGDRQLVDRDRSRPAAICTRLFAAANGNQKFGTSP